MTDRARAVITAGGTGGHIFPASALAEALSRRDVELSFVTDRRGRDIKGALGEVPTFEVSAGALAGRGLTGRIRGALSVLRGMLRAGGILRDIDPHVVIGFGGYASAPCMAAALRQKRPTVIHEQNAILGRANRLFARRVDVLASSFRDIVAVPPDTRIEVTGMPVRGEISALRDTAYRPPDDSGPIELLILGGSQGATVFADVVPDALKNLPAEIRSRLRVSQQCRPEDLDRVRGAYDKSGIHVDLSAFFADVPARLGRAHLVIARAGASTIAELTTAGRPSILVPYPYAIDDHQTANAQAVDRVGGGFLMKQSAFDPAAVTERLNSLFALPDLLARAAEAARGAGHANAAERLADLVMQPIGKHRGSANAGGGS